MNRLTIKKKCDLTVLEAALIQERLAKHPDDKGPPTCWNVYQNGLYAFFEPSSHSLVGLAEASGRPIVAPGWWVDSEFRGKHYGSALVDTLAEFLKADGATQVGQILIQTHLSEHDARSESLKKRFISHFT